MDARTFGNYLSRMRKAQGLTQAELAEQLHVTMSAVLRVQSMKLPQPRILSLWTGRSEQTRARLWITLRQEKTVQ